MLQSLALILSVCPISRLKRWYPLIVFKRGTGYWENSQLLVLDCSLRMRNRFIRRIPSTTHHISEQWHQKYVWHIACNFLLWTDITYHFLPPIYSRHLRSLAVQGPLDLYPEENRMKTPSRLLMLFTVISRGDAWYAILFFLASSLLQRNSKSRGEQLKVLNHAASLMGDRRIITVSLELLLSLVGGIIIISTSWRPPEAAYRHGPGAPNDANIII